MSDPFDTLAKGSNKSRDSKKKKRARSTSESQQLLMDDSETESVKSHTDSVFKKIKRRLSMGSKGSREDKTTLQPMTASSSHLPKSTHKRSTSDMSGTSSLRVPDAPSVPMYSVFTHAPPILLSPQVDEMYFTPKNVYLNLASEMRNANDEQIETLVESNALAISTLTAEVRELKKTTTAILKTLHGVNVARTVLKDRPENRANGREVVERETPGCFSCFSSFFGAD